MLHRGRNFEAITAKDIMTKNPKTIDADAMAIRAFNVMENNNITQLAVVDKNMYMGMIHLHDILKEGIV